MSVVDAAILHAMIRYYRPAKVVEVGSGHSTRFAARACVLKEWVIDQRLFWTEQYLLHAFLLFNSELEVLWASRFMQVNHGVAIEAVFPYYRQQHRITSCWMRRRQAPDAGASAPLSGRPLDQ